MNFYYVSDLAKEQIEIAGDDFKHSIKSMRLQSGDSIYLVDGKGNHLEASITLIERNRAMCKPVQLHENYHPLGYQLSMGVAPTKSANRYEWFLEKATELGISSITPIICSRSERRHLRTDRLQKILVSAMKQSLKAFLPDLSEIMDLEDYLKPMSPAEERFICVGTASGHLLERYNGSPFVNVLIGPEGDFTPEEIQLAIEKGYIPVHLGPQRLRTETAAILACGLISNYHYLKLAK